jgi:hypothetical protein
MSIPESIPEDRQESYECDCGGSRVQVGDHWECDKCDWVSTPPPVQSDQPDTDPHFRCTVCGQIGTVGRCCGLETREAMNEAARMEIDRHIEDRREKSESRAGIPPFESGEERRAVDRIL